ncbi:MAG: glycosyltransferase [Deltaproteobacteria bacterium]|nr:glycosyltransferase [Deltaproteobacteria bacterium]
MKKNNTIEPARHRVAILGASVSAQTVNHGTGEVVGYAEVLRRKYMEEMGAAEIVQYCYPGNRVSDGGIVMTAELVANGASVCIFEPLVEELKRGVHASREEVIWVYRTLLQAKIYIIVFFVAHPEKRKPEYFEQYALHREICDALNIPTVEIDLEGMDDLDKKYRGVHTWLPGAEMYAERIVKKWRTLDLSPESLDSYFSKLRLPSTSVRVANTVYDGTEDIGGLRLRGRVEYTEPNQSSCYLRIIQPQWIGPFSPVLDVTVSVWNGQEWRTTAVQVSVWDRYCHYERMSHVVLFDGHLSDCSEYTIDIRVAGKAPAYDTVRHPVASWPDVSERKLKPRGKIFWISNGSVTLHVNAVPNSPLGAIPNEKSGSALSSVFAMARREFTGILWTLPTPAPAGAGNELQKANELLRMGKYAEALTIYMRLRQTIPFSTTLDFNIALARKRMTESPEYARNHLHDKNALTKSLAHIDAFDSSSLQDLMCTSLRWQLGATLPLLSIVIPCYNSGLMLSETIRQMLTARSIPFEIIVVDDGSTDGSFDLLNGLAVGYDNFCVISQLNTGAGGARNHAIPKIKGLYTFFLDADDTLDLSEISRAVLDAMAHDYDLVFLPYRVHYEESGRSDCMYASDLENFRKSPIAKTQWQRQRLAFGLTGFPWNRIILTDLLHREEVRFCDTMVHNDMLFHWQSISVSNRLSYWNGVVCTHRKFASGSLSSSRCRRRLAVFDAMAITFEALKDNPVFRRNDDIWNRISNQTLVWNRSILSDEVVSEYDTAMEAFKQKKIVDVALNRPPSPSPSPPLDISAIHTRRHVSVVTITRNILGEDPIGRKQNLSHFEKMLQSVLQQSYGRDVIEHIVIDGASTDGTQDLVANCRRDGRIDKLISEPDTGVYNAMNKGIRHSSGEYVVFLNAHDHLSPHGIEAMMDAVTQSESDYCFGNSITIDEKDNPIGVHRGNINRIYLGMPFCHQAAMFARRTFDKITFPESLRITTWGYAMELYLAGFRHAYCDETIAYFRSGGLSTSGATEHRYWGELRQIKMMIAAKVLDLPIHEYEKIRTATHFDLHDSKIEGQLLRDLLALMKNMNPVQKDFFRKCVAMLRLDEREIAV